MGPDKRLQNQVRRAHLVALSESLRLQLGQQAQVLQGPLAVADQARNGFRWLMTHPQWIAVAVAVPIALRPGRALGWGLKLWSGWRMWRQIQKLLPR